MPAPRTARKLTAIAFGALAIIAIGGLPSSAGAATCTPPPGANAIVVENCKQGTPSSIWDVPGPGNDNIRGYATDISANPGQTVFFKVDTSSNNYRLDIYRMGYYDGDGARKVDTVVPFAFPNQGPCDKTSGVVDCGNWSITAQWTVPASAVSGIYFAHLVRQDAESGESHIPFVVRNDASHSDLLFQTSDTTWQAYNLYGGTDLYSGSGPGGGPAPGRSFAVSYDRPFITRGSDAGQDFLFNAEYPMVRWMERNGYDVSYYTGVDADRLPASVIEQHKAYITAGHDEYWSGQQRANVEAARDAGVNLAFFSGNEVFWKTRWTDDHRKMVTYKETHEGGKVDPSPEWTGSWRDPRWSPPSDGGRPENGLTGTIFTVNSGTGSIQVPADDGAMRFWRGTSVASLGAGQTAVLPYGTLGYEWDSDLDNGARPAGLIDLSHTTLDNVQILLDYGSTYDWGSASHSLTMYRAASGALVFGAGTVQWAWGLDSQHDRDTVAPSTAMQQATMNLFADMGAQPGSRQSDLSAAGASTDHTAPGSAIGSAPSSFSKNQTVTVSGTASDALGGRVAAVEVSTDGGTTWHPASGRETWTYTGQADGSGPVKSRAVDDSGNLEGGPGTFYPGPVGPDKGNTPGTGGSGTGSGSGGKGGNGSGSGSGAKPGSGIPLTVGPTHVRMSRKGVVTLKVSCGAAEQRCGKVKLRLQTHGGSTVASTKRSMAKSHTLKFALQLSRSGRRKLVKAHSLVLRAVATTSDQAGNSKTTRTLIRVRAPRGK